MNTFHLKIYESDSAFFEGEAEIVVIPASDGEYGVMAGHENAVIAVVPGIMHYRPKGGEMQYASVGNGMLRAEKEYIESFLPNISSVFQKNTNSIFHSSILISIRARSTASPSKTRLFMNTAQAFRLTGT